MDHLKPKNRAFDAIRKLPENATWDIIINEIKKSWAEEIPEEIFHRTLEVFADEKKAIGWLTRPNRALGGEIPAKLAKNERGAKEIMATLVRIESGVYS